MAKTKIVQNSFVSGVMDDQAFGRTDIGKFYNSVAKADNMLVSITGGMFKRPGFQFVDKTDIYLHPLINTRDVRLIDFTFNTDQKYLFLIYSGIIDIYHVPLRTSDFAGLGAPLQTVSVPELTPDVIREMDVIQRGDITLFFHTNLQTRSLSRIEFDAFVWGTLEMVPPLEDIEDPLTEMWSNELGWPSYGTFYQGRLWCAGSKTYPLTVWGSKTQDYFGFQIDPSDAAEPGSPLKDTIDSDKINHITGIFGGRKLQVFTTGSEFMNTSNFITPLDSSWNIQTRYGSRQNVPLDSVDGSTFFIDRWGAVREFIYDYTQEANVSNDLTTLAAQLFNNPFRMITNRSATSTLGRFTFVLNQDGTMAVLNFNKAEQLIAWTKMDTPHGKIVDIATLDNEFYMLVQTDTNIELHRLDVNDPATYIDGYTKVEGRLADRVCGNLITSCVDTIGGNKGWNWLLDNVWCENCLMFVDPTTPPIVAIGGFERFEGESVALLLDNIYQGDFVVQNGYVPIDRPFKIAEVGLKFDSVLKSLPIASPSAQLELAEKRIIKVKLYMYKSSAFYLDGELIPNLLFDVSNFDEAPAVVTGVYEHWGLGWSTLNDYTISSDSPAGFNILKTETHIDVTE